MSETDGTVERLERIVSAMRRLGVVRFDSIELGPAPADASERPEADETQRTDRLKRHETEREHRLRFGASGGPRPRSAV